MASPTRMGVKFCCTHAVISLALPPTMAGRAEAFACDEVAHVVVGDVGLELRQCGRVVAAGEPADRHDRSAGLQFEAADRERSDTGCGPTVVETLHELGERGVVCLGTAWPTSVVPESEPPWRDPKSSSVRCARPRRSRRCRPRTRPPRKGLPRQPVRRWPGPAGARGRQASPPPPPTRPARPSAAQEPVRRAVQQNERPDSGRRRHRRKHETHRQAIPDPPQLAHRDAHQRRDRRCQGDGVIRVHGAVHEAEHRGAHQKPATPQQQACANTAGAGGTAGQPQSGDQPDQGGRKQPRRLGTHRHPEQPADARIAAEEQVARAPWTTWAAPGTATEGSAEVARAGITPAWTPTAPADHALDAVVAQRQL